MTAGLAYTAAPTPAWPGLGEDEGAVEKLAVSWAVLRYSATIPASVEDQASIAAATKRVLDVAAMLGKTEEDLRSVLLQLPLGATAPGGPYLAEERDWLA